MEYQAHLDRDTAKVKADAEGVAAAKQERENRDIRDAQLLLRAKEDRLTVLEGIREAGAVVGDGVTKFLSDGKKVATTVGVITAIAAGIYGARMASNVGFKYLSNKLVKVRVLRSG